MSASHSQPMGDMPQITSSLYGSSSTAIGTRDWTDWTAQNTGGGSLIAPYAAGLAPALAHHQQQPTESESPMPEQATARRIVQVFIADPNPNVPLDRALLYQGTVKFTDATDQELYFEVPIVELLARHNADRVKWPDREASKRAGKDVLLDAARVRDLRMVVVNVASF